MKLCYDTNAKSNSRSSRTKNTQNMSSKNPSINTAITRKQSQDFKKEIWQYYENNKRDLPWRNTTDPYRILVSEVMLQQTQVSRVIPKYAEFLKKFSSIKALALASKADVLTLWQGLGYNRRALFLKKACETLYSQNPKRSQFPSTKAELVALPGIGQSTAGALLAFAFNKAEPFIETNIRAVFLYFFFKENLSVSDTNIYELISETLDHERPREWYYALYDYGVMLKAKLGKKKTALHKQSKHYNKQSSFKGSNREIRSNILKLFIAGAKGGKAVPLSESEIIKTITKMLPQATKENVETNIKALYKEGFIETFKRNGGENKSNENEYALSRD
jgi:A/G-specific adenine glycosylase